MANSTHIRGLYVNENFEQLNELADHFPPHVGWFSVDDQTTTSLLLQGRLLAEDENVFPLRARIRLFNKGEMFSEFFTNEIHFNTANQTIINEYAQNQKIDNGYFEVTVFSNTEAGKEHSYFGEEWCTVTSKNKKMNLTYPPLNSRGVAVYLLDADELYYPGVVSDSVMTGNLVVVNHYDFETGFDLQILNADGTDKVKKRIEVSPKAVHVFSLDDVVEDSSTFFAKGPGCLVFKNDYKLNAYWQTVHKKTGSICGMDHLGLLFSNNDGSLDDDLELKKIKTVNQKRLEDPVVCYCRGFSESELEKISSSGAELNTFMRSTGVGLACKGCVKDLKNIFSKSTY